MWKFPTRLPTPWSRAGIPSRHRCGNSQRGCPHHGAVLEYHPGTDVEIPNAVAHTMEPCWNTIQAPMWKFPTRLPTPWSRAGRPSRHRCGNSQRGCPHHGAVLEDHPGTDVEIPNAVAHTMEPCWKT